MSTEEREEIDAMWEAGAWDAVRRDWEREQYERADAEFGPVVVGVDQEKQK